MTMPDERTRSLRWGHELLAEISADSELSSEIRDLARSVGLTFPSPQAVQALIASNAESLPVDLAVALETARALFVEIQMSGTGSAATRKGVVYTLRHFPPAGAASSAASGRFIFGIESWVARDENVL